MSKNKKTLWWIKISLTGMLLFILLFVMAASLYPGGSYEDRTAKGFSWLNNYWCDLLSTHAKNGQPNTARPVAVIAWFILCFSLCIFWYFLPVNFLITKTHKIIIRYCGLLSMAVAAALFTSLHDEVIYCGGIFGFISLVAIYIALYKSRLYVFFYTGIACAFLILINYYIVLSGTYISWLPLIQKFTFAIVLLWMYCICKKLFWPQKRL